MASCVGADTPRTKTRKDICAKRLAYFNKTKELDSWQEEETTVEPKRVDPSRQVDPSQQIGQQVDTKRYQTVHHGITTPDERGEEGRTGYPSTNNGEDEARARPGTTGNDIENIVDELFAFPESISRLIGDSYPTPGEPRDEIMDEDLLRQLSTRDSMQDYSRYITRLLGSESTREKTPEPTTHAGMDFDYSQKNHAHQTLPGYDENSVEISGNSFELPRAVGVCSSQDSNDAVNSEQSDVISSQISENEKALLDIWGLTDTHSVTNYLSYLREGHQKSTSDFSRDAETRNWSPMSYEATPVVSENFEIPKTDAEISSLMNYSVGNLRYTSAGSVRNSNHHYYQQRDIDQTTGATGALGSRVNSKSSFNDIFDQMTQTQSCSTDSDAVDNSKKQIVSDFTRTHSSENSTKFEIFGAERSVERSLPGSCDPRPDLSVDDFEQQFKSLVDFDAVLRLDDYELKTERLEEENISSGVSPDENIAMKKTCWGEQDLMGENRVTDDRVTEQGDPTKAPTATVIKGLNETRIRETDVQNFVTSTENGVYVRTPRPTCSSCVSQDSKKSEKSLISGDGSSSNIAVSFSEKWNKSQTGEQSSAEKKFDWSLFSAGALSLVSDPATILEVTGGHDTYRKNDDDNAVSKCPHIDCDSCSEDHSKVPVFVSVTKEKKHVRGVKEKVKQNVRPDRTGPDADPARRTRPGGPARGNSSPREVPGKSAGGYARRWEKSSLAWSSYETNHLNTWSSVNLEERARGKNSTPTNMPFKSASRGAEQSAGQSRRHRHHDRESTDDVVGPVDGGGDRRTSAREEEAPMIPDGEAGDTDDSPSMEVVHSTSNSPLNLHVQQLDMEIDQKYESHHRLSIRSKDSRETCAELLSTPRESLEGVSCWLYLPSELWLYILSYLNHTDLSRLSLTCRNLHRLASDHSLWRVITLKNRRLQNDWLTLIGRRRPCVLSLIQCHGDDVTVAGLRDLFRGCADSLTELNCVGCSGGPLSGDNFLLHVGSRCSSLTSIDLSWSLVQNHMLSVFAVNIDSLERFCINGCHMITDDGLTSVLGQHAETLTTLEVFGCFNISTNTLSDIRRCRKLTKLNLGQCPQLTDECVYDMTASLGKLETLMLRGCTQITIAMARAVVRHCPKLTTIVLANCPLITNTVLVELSTYLPSIRSVDVSGCKKITDEGVFTLASNTNCLTELDLSSTSITTKSVSLLSSYSASTLEVLKLSFCKDIDEECLVHLAKHCQRLKLLHLYGCKKLRDLGKIQHENSKLQIEHHR